MKAQDINLTLEEALAKSPSFLKRKIEYSVNLIRKAEKMALRLDPDEGFYNTFSGGKDSQCLFHLMKMAGVRFDTHMSLTSVDPAEVIRFVKREYPCVRLTPPRMSIYDRCANHARCLPTRLRRWCCAYFKETGGVGKVTVTGIRHEESLRRRSRQEISGDVGRQRLSEDFDQFSEHAEQTVACVGGKDKIILSPILQWTFRDVWTFLNDVLHVPHCALYDQGYTRIGCLCCPMASYKQKVKDITRYPHVKRGWIRAIQSLIDQGYIKSFKSAEEGFEWYISGKSVEDFLADKNVNQKYKLKLFDDE